MRYNLLFFWFVGLSLEDAVWSYSVFSKDRDRLFESEVVESLFTEVMSHRSSSNFNSLLTVNAYNGTLQNQAGQLVSDTALKIDSGALDNTAGLLQADTTLTVDIPGQALFNRNTQVNINNSRDA